MITMITNFFFQLKEITTKWTLEKRGLGGIENINIIFNLYYIYINNIEKKTKNNCLFGSNKVRTVKREGVI